jgi:hypothetical protein
MDEIELEETEVATINSNWRARALLIGALVGGLFGVGAAYIYVNSVQKTGKQPEVQASEAVGIGLALMALLRQIATLHEGDEKRRKLK